MGFLNGDRGSRRQNPKTQIPNYKQIQNHKFEYQNGEQDRRCNRSNSFEIERQNIHRGFVSNLSFSDLEFFGIFWNFLEFVWDLSFVFWNFAPLTLIKPRKRWHDLTVKKCFTALPNGAHAEFPFTRANRRHAHCRLAVSVGKPATRESRF